MRAGRPGRPVAFLLRRMPESVTLEEICEELAILAGIRRGEADADAGRVVSHEEVKRRSEKSL